MRSGIRSYYASLLLYGVLRAFGEKIYQLYPIHWGNAEHSN